MSTRLTNLELQSFLKDFQDRAETEVIEKGKEKEEIIAIAKSKMGIDLIDNVDLAGFKTIYTFANIANGNGARVPKEILLKALPTLIGKAVNINHNRQYVVGYYIDYRYVERDDQVIAYGIFFKSNFGEEWVEAKELLKAKKLGTSHEVWCPKRSRKYLPDGSYEMQAVEFAGGALIYRTHEDPSKPGRKMETAYKGCDVLEFAMKVMDNQDRDLLFASLDHKAKKYQNEDLIFANDAKEFVNRSEQEIREKVESGFHKAHEVQEQSAEEQAPVEMEQPVPQPPVPQIPKVTCGNCNHTFETQDVGELKCSECKAIIDRTGKMLFPPQKIDFTFRDPEDGSSNWRLLETSEKTATVKNMDSGRIYELEYKTSDDIDELIDRMNFVYIGSASCPQCGHMQSISTPSNADVYETDCPRCGLHFHKNIKRETMNVQIGAYKDITETYKKQKEGGNEEVAENVELHIASLQDEEGQMRELEVASLVNDPQSEVHDLEIASLSSNLEPEKLVPDLEVASLQEEPEASFELDIASLESAESVPSGDNDLLGRYKTAVKKMSTKIRTLLRERNLETANLKSARELELAKIQEDAERKIEFYKANAVELNKRRDMLGQFGEELSDEKIMDDEVYAKAKLEKENALLKASQESNFDVVSVKIGREYDELNRLQKEIDGKAFKNNS